MVESRQLDLVKQDTRKGVAIVFSWLLGAVAVTSFIDGKPGVGERPHLEKRAAAVDVAPTTSIVDTTKTTETTNPQTATIGPALPLSQAIARDVPNPYDDDYESYFARSLPPSIDLFVDIATMENGDIRTMECWVDKPVEVAAGDGIWNTLTDNYSHGEQNKYLLTPDRQLAIIQTGIDLNIERGYLQSGDQVVHPGDELLSFFVCAETDFSYSAEGPLSSIRQELLDPRYGQIVVWERNDSSGEMETVLNTYGALD